MLNNITVMFPLPVYLAGMTALVLIATACGIAAVREAMKAPKDGEE